nr:Cortactin-binding protein like [Ipomoea batatas]
MSFALFINSMLQRLFSVPRLPLLFYAASWTTVLTVTVALASFTPELAFVSAITPASSFSAPCGGAGGSSSVRIPLDVPSEVFCFPAELFRKSKMDLVVPPIFAAVVVAASAYVVKALSLWESTDHQGDQGERH